jgi:hypothetical protein
MMVIDEYGSSNNVLLGENLNLTQCRFAHDMSHMNLRRIEITPLQ